MLDYFDPVSFFYAYNILERKFSFMARISLMIYVRTGDGCSEIVAFWLLGLLRIQEYVNRLLF